MTAPIRVLVADDSLTARKLLVDVLQADGGFDVVGEAADGRAAIELCQRLRPDVMTLDMAMPDMDGLTATEQIMAYCPTPILIVSAASPMAPRPGDALAAGALDVIEKGQTDAGNPEWGRRLVSTLRILSRVKVITHPRAKLDRGAGRARHASPGVAPAPAVTSSGPFRVVALGASTGGPTAVRTILQGLGDSFALPILLVLHLGEPVGPTFAEWLDRVSPLPVREAEEGESLPPVGTGQVLVAPPDRHLELREGRLRLTRGPERHSCRPSVDVLFESLARELGPRVAAGLLTGMGRDGAAGLLAIRTAGGLTLAQDAASSAVFGMPAEAIRQGAAIGVLHLDEFASTLRSLAVGTRPEVEQ